MESLLLRAALKRGVLLVSANWPVILIDFAVDSFCRLALALPVIGGALMVATIAGIDMPQLLSEGVIAAADVVVGSLVSAPAALAAFLAAIAVVGIGSEVVRFIVKAGTLSILVTADRQAGELHCQPLAAVSLASARTFGLERLVTASHRFVGRGIQLSIWLALAYGFVVILYLALITWDLPAGGSAWLPAWSALVLAATSTAIVVTGVARLTITLLRVVIVTDDCPISTAAVRLVRFGLEDARQVIGVAAVIGGIQIVAAVVGVLAASGLAPIAYVPVVGLALVPLQAALWLLRSLVFDALALVGASACQTQYRRFAERHALPHSGSGNGRGTGSGASGASGAGSAGGSGSPGGTGRSSSRVGSSCAPSASGTRGPDTTSSVVTVAAG